jgi:hypothetical protein
MKKVCRIINKTNPEQKEKGANRTLSNWANKSTKRCNKFIYHFCDIRCMLTHNHRATTFKQKPPKHKPINKCISF